MAANLPKTYHEGYCYFTVDDGKFYIDTTDDASGRIVLNAASADTDRLNNIIDETYVTSEELDEIFDGVPGLIDADTLGGRFASDYLLKDEFSVNYDQIIMPDGTIWDGIAATITDTELSTVSDSPVANKVITTALNNIENRVSNIKKLSSDPRENDEGNPMLSTMDIIKKKYPIVDENGQSTTYPTFASQVFFNDGTSLENNVINRIFLEVPAVNWVQADTGRYTQLIPIEGVTEYTKCYHLDIDMSNATEDNISDIKKAWSYIDYAETITGGILLTCFTDVPTIDFTTIAYFY